MSFTFFWQVVETTPDTRIYPSVKKSLFNQEEGWLKIFDSMLFFFEGGGSFFECLFKKKKTLLGAGGKSWVSFFFVDLCLFFSTKYICMTNWFEHLKKILSSVWFHTSVKFIGMGACEMLFLLIRFELFISDVWSALSFTFKCVEKLFWQS